MGICTKMDYTEELKRLNDLDERWGNGENVGEDYIALRDKLWKSGVIKMNGLTFDEWVIFYRKQFTECDICNKDVKVTNNCKAENRCYKCNNKDLLCENFELKENYGYK